MERVIETLDQALIVADRVCPRCQRLRTGPCHHHCDQALLVNGLIRVGHRHRVDGVEKGAQRSLSILPGQMLDLLEPQFRLNNRSRPAPPLAAIEEATRLGQCLQRLPQAVCDALRPSRDCRFISVKKCPAVCRNSTAR
jgi:hypothetical protein